MFSSTLIAGMWAGERKTETKPIPITIIINSQAILLTSVEVVTCKSSARRGP